MSIPTEALLPYLPRMARDWATDPDRKHTELDASLLFADLSGFTGMTERLAKIGRRGAEEVSSIISEVFEAMLVPAYEAGGSLIKFGGDALFLLFEGEDHARAAAWAAWAMRSSLRRRGPVSSSIGKVSLGMTSAVASGKVHVFMPGAGQREMLVVGDTVTTLMGLERLATTGETLVSPETAGSLRSSEISVLADGSHALVRRPRPVTPSEVRPYLTQGDIEAFVPAAVTRRFDDDQVAPEHRRIAIGFVGVSNVDVLVRSDPAAAADALDHLITLTQQTAAEHGAWLLATDVAPDGAKLIITAGAPVATGHDEASVLLTLSELLGTDTPFDLRLGANHGTVFFGDIGPSYRRTLTVMGDTVNTSARLMGAAPPDAVLAPTSMLGSRHLHVAHRPPYSIELRGRRQPIEVVEVTGPDERKRDAAASSRLIGREEELARLAAAREAVLENRGGVIEVIGPPGSGRSRLVDEFLDRSDTVACVRLETGLHERGVPFALTRRLFREVTGVDPTEPGSGHRLAEAIRQHAVELVPQLSYLARPLGMDGLDESAAAAVDAQFLPALIRRAAASVLRVLGPRPLILAVDDAHLADPASLDILRHLGGEAAALGWLVCVTAPEGGLIDWPGVDVEAVELRELDHEALTAMALGLTESDPLSSHDLNEIVHRAGGNPLVLREMISARRDDVDLASLPTEAEALAAMRIDSLPPERRHQIEVASVLGSVFDPELYALVGNGTRSDLVEDWDDGLLQTATDKRVRFTNSLLRDVVYDRLPFAFRTHMHLKVADILSATDASSDELAFHLYRAERWDAAFDAALDAGEKAEATFANVEAVQWYEAALDSAQRSRAPIQLQADLWKRIGETRERIGEFAVAAAAFQRAHQTSADELTRARLAIRRARMLEKLGTYRSALATLTRARARAPDQPDVVSAVVAHQAGIRFYQGHHRRAVQLAEEVIALPESTETTAARALALMILDMARSASGEQVDGENSRQALALYRQLGDLGGQARVTNNLGLFAFYRGDWEKARQLYNQSREIFTQIGDEVNASYGAANAAEILAVQGWFTEAESLFREVRRVWRAADDRYGAAYIEGQLGLIAARRGRFDEADTRVRRAIDQFEEIGARAEVAETAAHLAESALLVGDPAEARRVLESHGLTDSSPPGASLARVARLVAIADWQEGTEAAEESVTRALMEARESGAVLDELWLLELRSRAGLPPFEDERREDLTARLGIIMSPVFPDLRHRAATAGP